MFGYFLPSLLAFYCAFNIFTETMGVCSNCQILFTKWRIFRMNRKKLFLVVKEYSIQGFRSAYLFRMLINLMFWKYTFPNPWLSLFCFHLGYRMKRFWCSICLKRILDVNSFNDILICRILTNIFFPNQRWLQLFCTHTCNRVLLEERPCMHITS